MVYLFIFICLVIVSLIILMFFILRNTVRKINNQTKTYFVDKLQEYDYLIDEKEKELKELEETIENKKNNDKDDYKFKNKYITFDSDIIDLYSKTDYENRNVFLINKEMNDKFVIDYEELIKDFISNIVDNDEYDFCVNLRNKFDSKKIYEFKLLLSDEIDKNMQIYLSDDEYMVYLAYKKITNMSSIDGFVNYLDELVDLNNPNIFVYVGSKNENYDYLSKYIKTIVSKDIYKGIKIVYRNKIYDFSLNERNV